METKRKGRLLLVLFGLFVSVAAAQVSPQIQGAGAPSNPCGNGGQDYVDQTNHVLYHCPSAGANWVNIGLGNTSSSTGAQFTATGPGPALSQTEETDPGAPGANISSLYANSIYQRWVVYNHNAGPKVLGTWMVTTPGGLQYGGASQINGINTEALFSGNASGTGFFSENASGVPAWVASTQLSSVFAVHMCGGTVGATNATAYFFWPTQFSMTTCTSSTGQTELPVGITATASLLQVTAGTACTSAATAVTLYKNGSATALSVTGLNVTAGTVVKDTTHTVPFLATDSYSIRVVTGQATETCANLRALVYITQ